MENCVLVLAGSDSNIECCDYETGKWQLIDTTWNDEKCGHIVENLIPGHTYSFRIIDKSIPSSSSSTSLLPSPSSSISSHPITVPYETGSWQQDHLLRRYQRSNHIVGRGRTSCIEEAEDNGTGQKVALKQIERQRQTQCLTRNEYQVLASISHQNIIHCLALFENAPSPGIDTIVLELVNGNDVSTFICQHENIQMKILQSLTNQLMCGLDFLKENNIVHCDIKPENLMVEVTDKNHILKIVDFGSALHCNDILAHSVVVDLEFTAPELIENCQKISSAIDVWSAGVVFYVLLSGVSPFLDESTEETIAHIKNQDFSFPDDYFTDVPHTAKDLISKMLILDSKSRLTPCEVLNSDWMKQDVSNVTVKTNTLRSFIERRKQYHGSMQHIILLNYPH